MKNSSFSDFFETQTLQNQAKNRLSQGTISLLSVKKMIIVFLSFFKLGCAVNKILKSSKGRDKICGVIQYNADFVSSCQKYSNIDATRNLYL